jgi:hypothetical protein
LLFGPCEPAAIFGRECKFTNKKSRLAEKKQTREKYVAAPPGGRPQKGEGSP